MSESADTGLFGLDLDLFGASVIPKYVRAPIHTELMLNRHMRHYSVKYAI